MKKLLIAVFVFGFSLTAFASTTPNWLALNGAKIYSSIDGNSWTYSGPTPAPVGIAAFGKSASGNSEWLILPNVTLNDKNYIYSSTDGKTWKAHLLQYGLGYVAQLFYHDGIWLAATDQGVASSTDGGLSWQFDSQTFTQINGVAVGKNANDQTKWIAVGKYITQFNQLSIYTSTNGQTWQRTTTSDAKQPNFNAIAYGDGHWIAVGTSLDISGKRVASIYVSKDGGSTWQTYQFPNISALNNVAIGKDGYGNLEWVAVGDGVMFTSPNATDWTEHKFSGINFNTIKFSNGRWVAMGKNTAKTNSTIYTSTNGQTWENVTPANTPGLSGLATNGQSPIVPAENSPGRYSLFNATSCMYDASTGKATKVKPVNVYVYSSFKQGNKGVGVYFTGKTLASGQTTNDARLAYSPSMTPTNLSVLLAKSPDGFGAGSTEYSPAKANGKYYVIQTPQLSAPSVPYYLTVMSKDPCA